MTKNLLIVESPAKAKTIEKYLGGDFIVKSSYGHIRDLDKGKKGVDIENGFVPNYVVSTEKQKVVKELKSHAKKVSEVWLATDEDREGEAISWHLCKVLDLDETTTKRIVFREITKPAILSAVENPRNVDINLVEAQQARRILDRLVGFELSEILWRKVKGKLSAGRVQSVAVKLVVDKEREINSFTVDSFFKLSAIFKVKNERGELVDLVADLATKIMDEEVAKSILEECKDGNFFIGDITLKPAKKKPSAPFTTSTLQQDASRKLGFNVRRTMSTAQKLYEQGFISYMRTDSVHLSDTAIKAIVDEITSSFGEKYSEIRTYKSKSSGAQEAHEAIRPTYFQRRNVSGEGDQQKLYDLIWKRTVASQMPDAELEKTQVRIENSNYKDGYFKAEGEVLIFDGFLKIYLESSDEEDNGEAKGILPPLKVGQDLKLANLEAKERFTKPPARYTEAGLVKKLEELGIGRPSTYAPTISKIMDPARGYVTRESRDGWEREYKIVELRDSVISARTETEITGSTSKRLYPSDIGMIVTDFLSQHFESVMNYDFTAKVEKRLDNIASGEEQWKMMLNDFYPDFHATVEKTIADADRAKGTRELGKDPESGHTVLAQITRYGPVIQIGTVEEVGEEGKPRFANLRQGQSLETISYEEAMDLFQLPKTIGQYEEKDVEINIGRFGPYVKFDEKFISIPKGRDVMEVELDEAIDLIEQKRKEDAPIATFDGLPVTRGKGRFGPFLKWNEWFVNIPRRIDPEQITSDEIVELLEKKKEKEANRYIQRWEKEKISIENARWGPIIKKGRKIFKLPLVDGKKPEVDLLKTLSLDDVKAIIDGEVPKALNGKS